MSSSDIRSIARRTRRAGLAVLAAAALLVTGLVGIAPAEAVVAAAPGPGARGFLVLDPDGNPVVGTPVSVTYQSGSGLGGNTQTTDADGFADFAVLPAGTLVTYLNIAPVGEVVAASSVDYGGHPIALDGLTTVTLSWAVMITGRLVDSQTNQPLTAGSAVGIWGATNAYSAVGADGTFRVRAAAATTITLQLVGYSTAAPLGYAPQSQLVTTPADGTVALGDVAVDQNGGIKGKLQQLVNAAASDVRASAHFIPQGGGAQEGWADQLGQYTMALAPGTYKVAFARTATGPSFVPEQYFDRVASAAAAKTITVKPGQTVTNVNALFGASAAVSRLAGGDRFDTGVAVSAAQFAPGVSVAYVANGLNFPDALAAGPVAGANNGPILLARPDAVPASVAAELTRLKPGKIVILGGPGAVGDAVAKSLKTYTTGTVSRLAGPDRFGTSVEVAKSRYKPGTDVVYVANGMNFPDALATGPVAGIDDGPILLVRPDSIPGPTATELKRLKPDKIVILGGTGAVGANVATTLKTYTTGQVARVSGADRFETGVAVSKSKFTAGITTAYVANGLNFPDALAAGPVAAANGGPILLVRPDVIPASVVAELKRLKPAKIVMLGGPGAVSAAVATELAKYAQG